MQLEMFTDPLKEKALEVIERALKGSDADKVFASYYGWMDNGKNVVAWQPLPAPCKGE